MCSTNSWEALVWCNTGSYYHVHVSPSVCLTVFSALLDCLSDIYSSLCLCHSLPLLPLKRSPSVGPTSKGRRVSTITCALWSQWVSLNMLCCPRHCWCLICVCVCVFASLACVYRGCLVAWQGFWNIFCRRHWCVESVMFDIMGVLLCVLSVCSLFLFYILHCVVLWMAMHGVWGMLVVVQMSMGCDVFPWV